LRYVAIRDRRLQVPDVSNFLGSYSVTFNQKEWNFFSEKSH